jgi:nucleoid DNA-binding protein
MKKEQIARLLAKESRVSTVVAADQVDRIVSDLLMRVRRGEPASLPGLGTFQPGSQKEFHFDRAPKDPSAQPKKERR